MPDDDAHELTCLRQLVADAYAEAPGLLAWVEITGGMAAALHRAIDLYPGYDDPTRRPTMSATRPPAPALLKAAEKLAATDQTPYCDVARWLDDLAESAPGAATFMAVQPDVDDPEVVAIAVVRMALNHFLPTPAARHRVAAYVADRTADET